MSFFCEITPVILEQMYFISMQIYLRFSFAVDGLQSLPYGMRLKWAAQGNENKRYGNYVQ